MSCERCKGTGKIKMYMAYDKDHNLTTKRSADDMFIVTDREVDCWVCSKT